jgi:TatD DNase family protein
MEGIANLFDTHVHLDRLPAGTDAPREAAQARKAGVCRFLVPGVDPRHWQHLLAVAETVPGALAAPGAHPMAACLWNATTAAKLETLLNRETVIAIGEIGLDGSEGMPEATRQEQVLREQIRIALTAHLPMVLHCRKATGRLLDMLRQENASRTGGIWHGFSGSLETARAALRLGFVLAFGGPLTWPGARRAPEVLQALPPESIVLESDAPDLAPHPHRGHPNRPAYLPLVAAKVAELRGWSLEQTARITTANARRVLRLPCT